jgi:methionyl-tRNA formyltransferase
MLKKEDGALDFTLPAVALERRVRAFQPWPGAYLDWDGGFLKILRASVAEAPAVRMPGQRLVHGGLPAIQTAQGLLLLEEVQPAGKKPMPGKVFLQGARNWT